MTTTSSTTSQTSKVEIAVPPHLDNSPWLIFEQKRALFIYDDLSAALNKLAKKPSEKRVHGARVVLRRWDCIWNVMESDGWDSKKYSKNVGKELKRIRRMLGDLRDCDVNIEVAESLDVPQEVIDKWHEERKALAIDTKKKLKNLDVRKLLKKLSEFLLSRPQKLRKKFESDGTSSADSAYEHLEPFVASQEETARKLANEAKSPEELHTLRLAIKAWRYLLAEYYGLTNLQLVQAQSILGKLNDLHRVELLLEEFEKPLVNEALSKLHEQRENLLDDFTQFRETLPYGLRPSISSSSAKLKSN